MIPLTFLYDEYIDRPKLTEQKKNPFEYIVPPPHKWGRNNNQFKVAIYKFLWTDISDQNESWSVYPQGKTTTQELPSANQDLESPKTYLVKILNWALKIYADFDKFLLIMGYSNPLNFDFKQWSVCLISQF